MDQVQLVVTSSKWTSEHCLVPGGHEYAGSGNEYVFALLMGKDFLANAKSWGHVATDPTCKNFIFGLQCLIMAIDDGGQGSTYIDVDKKSRSRLYKRVVEALAKRMKHMAQKADIDIIRKYTSGRRWFNVDHALDVAEAVKAMDQKQEVEEEMEEEAEEPPAQRARVSRGPLLNVYDDPRFQDEYFCRAIGPVFTTSVTELANMPAIALFENENEQEHEEAVEEMIEEDEQAEVDDDAARNLLHLLGGDPDTRTLPKARFNVTPIYHKLDSTLLLGYLVRVIQVDPNWNPGATLADMIKVRRQRLEQRNNRMFVDKYAKFYPFRKTMFPVYEISTQQWTRLRNNICNEEATSNLLYRQLGSESVDNYDSSIHPCKIFTLERALQRLVEAGADEDIFKVENFRSADHKRFMYPVEVPHYRYLPIQVFWYDPHQLGLCEMTFPNVQLTNEALVLLNQVDQEQTITSSAFAHLEKLSAEMPVLNREEVLNAMPPVCGIPTKNIILLAAAEADMTERRIEAEKPEHFEETIRRVVAGDMARTHPRALEVQRYTEIVDTSHRHYMRQFENIFQLESDVTYISIPDTLKVLMRYLQDNYKNKPVSRYLRKFDKDMSLFGNVMARQCMFLDRVMRLLQPLITMKIEGVFGVYARRKGQLLYHYINYGGRDKGKSYHVIKGGKFQMVPNSYTQEQTATDASYLTDTDYEHVILFRDEVEEWVVNPKLAAGKDAKKANIKKSAMTEGENHMNLFEKQKIPGTDIEIRTNRKVASRQNIAEICTTNYSIQKGVGSSALISRYYAESMKSCTAPVEQNNWDVDPELKTEAKMFFHLNQAMCAIVEQAMTMNAIVREPTMDLWYDLAGRILDSLRMMGVVSREEGVRGLEKMSVFARHLVVKMAIHYAYDAPGAPFYGCKYHPSQLAEVQRYLYFREEYAQYLYTLLASEFVDEDCGIVLRAMCKMLHVEPNQDPYRQYTEGGPEVRKCFAKKYNSKYTKDDLSNGPQEWVELNYFQIEGDIKSVAQQVAEKTEPRMDVEMVQSVLEVLSKRQFEPQRTYMPLDPGQLNNHIRHTVAKERLSQNTVEAVIHMKTRELGMDSAQVHQLQRQYEGQSLRDTHSEADLRRVLLSVSYTDQGILEIDDLYDRAVALKLTPFQVHMILLAFEKKCIWEAGTPETYTYVERNPNGSYPHINDLPSLPVGKSISVVRYDNAFRGHRKVVFAPEAVRLFNPETIIAALEDAIICGSTKPGKRVLGFAHDEDMTKLRVDNWTPEFIQRRCEFSDKRSPAGAISRKEGIVFNRRGFMTKEVASMMYRNVPRINQAKANPIECVRDLDYESALKHHMKCPNPLIEPVRSPQYIEEAYNAAIATSPELSQGHGSLNYPQDIIKHKQQAERSFWCSNQTVVLDDAEMRELEALKKR